MLAEGTWFGDPSLGKYGVYIPKENRTDFHCWENNIKYEESSKNLEEKSE